MSAQSRLTIKNSNNNNNNKRHQQQQQINHQKQLLKATSSGAFEAPDENNNNFCHSNNLKMLGHPHHHNHHHHLHHHPLQMQPHQINYAGSILRKPAVSPTRHLQQHDGPPSIASSVSNEPHSMTYRLQKPPASRDNHQLKNANERHNRHHQIHQQLQHIYGKVPHHHHHHQHNHPHHQHQQHQHHQHHHQHQQQPVVVAPQANEKQRLLFKRRKQQIQQHFDQRLNPSAQAQVEQQPPPQEASQYINVENLPTTRQQQQLQQQHQRLRSHNYSQENLYVPIDESARGLHSFRAQLRPNVGEEEEEEDEGAYMEEQREGKSIHDMPITPIAEELDDELEAEEAENLSHNHYDHQQQRRRQQQQRQQQPPQQSQVRLKPGSDKPEDVALAAIAALFKATAANAATVAASAALNQQQQHHHLHKQQQQPQKRQQDTLNASNTYQEIRRPNMNYNQRQQPQSSRSQAIIEEEEPVYPVARQQQTDAGHQQQAQSLPPPKTAYGPGSGNFRRNEPPPQFSHSVQLPLAFPAQNRRQEYHSADSLNLVMRPLPAIRQHHSFSYHQPISGHQLPPPPLVATNNPPPALALVPKGHKLATGFDLSAEMLGKMMCRNLMMAPREPLAIADRPTSQQHPRPPNHPLGSSMPSSCDSLEMRAYETAMRIMDSHVLGNMSRGLRSMPVPVIKGPGGGPALVHGRPLPLIMNSIKQPGLTERMGGINLADFWWSLLMVAFLFAGAVVLIFSII